MMAVEVVRSPETVQALLAPPRLRILEHLTAPDSAAGVARLMDMPRQQVNYHLRELERVGLVQFVEERRKGNCMERVVQAVARSFVISPEALGNLGATPEEQQDRFSLAYLVSLAARMIRELATIRERALAAGKRISTLGLESEIRFANAADRHAFAEELGGAIARLAAKYHDANTPGGRSFRLVAGIYPAITKQEHTQLKSVGME